MNGFLPRLYYDSLAILYLVFTVLVYVYCGSVYSIVPLSDLD